MKYESTILKRLIDTYGVVGNPHYISEIIKEFIVQGKECYPDLFTYQSDWLAHIDEFGLKPSYTVSYTGQSIYAPNTLEKPVKSAILKGMTIKVDCNGNPLFDDIMEKMVRGKHLKREGISEHGGEMATVDFLPIPDDSFKVYVNTTWFKIAFYDENETLIQFYDTTDKSTIFEIPNNAKYCRFGRKVDVTDGGTPYFHLKDVNNGNMVYPKSYLQSVKMPVLKATGKNLINSEIIAGWINTSNGEINNLTSTTTCATKDLIKIKGGTQYSIYKEYNKRVLYAQFNENQEFINFGTYAHNAFTTDSNAAYVRLFFETPLTDEIKVMLYEGAYNSVISYEPYKTNILSCLEPVELGSVGEVKDELNLLTQQLTQRTETRPYQEGDELNSEFVTDMTNTRYKLAQEVVKTVDLTILDQNGQNVKQLMSFNGGTHFNTGSSEGSPLPTVIVSVETDLEETLKVCSLEGNTL